MSSTNEWFRGVLEPCLLALVAQRESYGYELATQLEAAGIGSVPGGTLYPALLRLEKRGLLVSTWRPGDGGPGRKYYRLSPAGRRALRAEREEWESFASAVGAILTAGAPR